MTIDIIDPECPYCGRRWDHTEAIRTHYLVCTCGKTFTSTPHGWVPGLRSKPELAPDN